MMPKNPVAVRQRYYLIDSLRGAAIISMVIFHLFYDLFVIYIPQSGWISQPLTAVWERSICVTFILISGISLNFSKCAYKRGIVLNICGFIVTTVTVLLIPSEAVWFGILNFLGCAVLILQPLRVYLDKIPPAFGTALSFLLYAVTYGVPNGFIGLFKLKFFDLPEWLYRFKWLSFLGFRSPGFMSTDYFPIIPWIFLFAAGYFLWRFIKEINAEKYFCFRVPVLDAIGRHSLLIYLAHQPIIMGVCMLIF